MAENLPTRPRSAMQSSAVRKHLPAPPKHLSAESRRMWRSIVGEWVLGSEALPLLRAALEQWDGYQAARAQVARDGPTFRAGNLIRQHPAAKVAYDSLTQYRQCLRQLGLEPPEAT